MRKARVVIVGGGLSGLYAARLLTQNGILDWELLEARGSLGGRILSISSVGTPSKAAFDTIDRFDLGPSWFWPGYQRQLDLLVAELGLERFEQYEIGDMVLEHAPKQAASRMQGHASSPPSMRLIGGMGALIDALADQLDASRIHLGQTVSHLRAIDADGPEVLADCQDATGRVSTWRGAHVLL